MVSVQNSKVVFNPDTFLRDLDEGRFDGELREVLRRLTPDQLREVSQLMTERLIRQKGAARIEAERRV
jgi:hypothetical protein